MKRPSESGGPFRFLGAELSLMLRHVGHVVIESIAAENPKFTSSLVFVHGLWCTASVWRKFMGFFAHRGWTSIALNLRGRAGSETPLTLGAVRLADYLNDVHQVVAACEAPPVLIGHDLGGLLALASASEARAVVALTPLLPRNLTTTANRALSQWRTRLAMAWSCPLPPPRGRIGAAYFGSDPPGGTTSDSGHVAHELVRGEISVPTAGDTPTLILAGAADPFVQPSDVERLANQIGAHFRCVEGATHAMPWEPGWEQRVAEIHRWLIQTLGEGLLLPREEDEA
jgi:pimeloyl-ACP methyl ester carboxylesterase